MDSQQFAQENPWISHRQAMRIADEHGLLEEAADDILRGGDIETRDAVHRLLEVNTASLLLWLGY